MLTSSTRSRPRSPGREASTADRSAKESTEISVRVVLDSAVFLVGVC